MSFIWESNDEDIVISLAKLHSTVFDPYMLTCPVPDYAPPVSYHVLDSGGVFITRTEVSNYAPLLVEIRKRRGCGLESELLETYFVTDDFKWKEPEGLNRMSKKFKDSSGIYFINQPSNPRVGFSNLRPERLKCLKTHCCAV